MRPFPRPLLRNTTLFRIFLFLLRVFLRLKFNYHFEKVKPKHRPYIVLANHATNYDPIMLGESFPELLHYVASDHIFRLGRVSKLLMFLVEPIPRLKSSTELQTVKQVLNKLRKGFSVCIFAEGNMTFSGETGYIPISTGKLVKLSGVALITYRIDGGYFSNPRWGKKLRKGCMSGQIVSEYSPETISDMTVAELNDVIKKDLYVNAYDEQKVKQIPYQGIDIAENLEIALYLCPLCGRIGTLKSIRDEFYCPCGLHLRYTQYGYFESGEGGDPPFPTVLEWFRWQSTEIEKKTGEFFEEPIGEPFFSDNGQSLWLIGKASHAELQGRGTLYLFNDRLELEQENGSRFSFPLERISDMSIYGRMVLIFTTNDQMTYEIKSDHSRSAVKYLDVFQYYKSNKNH